MANEEIGHRMVANPSETQSRTSEVSNQEIERLAAQKENPELWAHKFLFGLSVLRLSQREAMALADNVNESYLSAKR